LIFIGYEVITILNIYHIYIYIYISDFEGAMALINPSTYIVASAYWAQNRKKTTTRTKLLINTSFRTTVNSVPSGPRGAEEEEEEEEEEDRNGYPTTSLC
jgi:hypothetical protein